MGSAKVLTPLQARNLAQQALADTIKGEDPQALKKRLRMGHTLGSFIENEYATHCLAQMRTGTGTVDRLKSRFSEFWNRPLLDRTLRDGLLTWRTRRATDGISNSTINPDIAALRAAFSHAVRLELLTEDGW